MHVVSYRRGHILDLAAAIDFRLDSQLTGTKGEVGRGLVLGGVGFMLSYVDVDGRRPIGLQTSEGRAVDARSHVSSARSA